MNNYQIDFTKLKAVEYNRKSSEGEDKQVLSIQSQKEENVKTAIYYKLPTLIASFEESKSAKKEFERPEFSKMLDMIDNCLDNSFYKKSRNGWIREAIEKKIKEVFKL